MAKSISACGNHVLTHSRSLLVAFAMCGMAVPVANAVIITYTSVPNWTNDTNHMSIEEDFDRFPSDTSFNNPLSLLAGMTIGTMMPDANIENKVDVSPFEFFATFNINPTPYAKIFNGQFGSPTTPYILFNIPINAFMADFRDLNDDFVRTNFDLYDRAALLDTLNPQPPTSLAATSFRTSLGFRGDAGECITELRMRRTNNDVFGMDNIRIVPCNTVTEPFSLSLVGLGLIGVVASRRCRKWVRQPNPSSFEAACCRSDLQTVGSA